jgi:hypothetical protein
MGFLFVYVFTFTQFFFFSRSSLIQYKNSLLFSSEDDEANKNWTRIEIKDINAQKKIIENKKQLQKKIKTQRYQQHPTTVRRQVITWTIAFLSHLRDFSASLLAESKNSASS